MKFSFDVFALWNTSNFRFISDGVMFHISCKISFWTIKRLKANQFKVIVVLASLINATLEQLLQWESSVAIVLRILPVITASSVLQTLTTPIFFWVQLTHCISLQRQRSSITKYKTSRPSSLEHRKYPSLLRHCSVGWLDLFVVSDTFLNFYFRVFQWDFKQFYCKRKDQIILLQYRPEYFRGSLLAASSSIASLVKDDRFK